MKKILSFVLVMLTLLCLVSCGAQNPKTEYYVSHGFTLGDTVYAYLPRFKPDIVDTYDGHLIYKYDIDVAAYNEYIANAGENGYSVRNYGSSAVLYRDGEFINCTKPTADSMATCTVYTQKKDTKGITAEEAGKILGMQGAITPVDITPNDMYEKTGTQMFITSVDYLLNKGKEGTGSYSYTVIFYVKDGTVMYSGYASFAECDIDGDGKKEQLVLDVGPTSGIATFRLYAYCEGKLKYDCVYYGGAAIIVFAEYEGKLYVASDSDSLEWNHFAYEVRYEKGTINLYDGENQIAVWNKN